MKTHTQPTINPHDFLSRLSLDQLRRELRRCHRRLPFVRRLAREITENIARAIELEIAARERSSSTPDY